MIVVKLTGGLGNQMFQYALGRHLSLRRGVPLKLDVTYYKKRHFRLHQWNTQFEVATAEELSTFRQRQRRHSPAGVMHLLLPSYLRPYIKERDIGFHPEILKATGNCYLEGYWQNEGYFAEIASVIRQDFTLREPMSNQAREFMARIEAAENPVAVGIRRGDYVTGKEVTEKIGLLPMSYYEKAIKRMAELVPNPHFFLSSDEPEWVAENMKLDYPSTIVPDLGREHVGEQLSFLRACKHFIVANSSFHWWGAWLSENPDKHVLAPRSVVSQHRVECNIFTPFFMGNGGVPV